MRQKAPIIFHMGASILLVLLKPHQHPPPIQKKIRCFTDTYGRPCPAMAGHGRPCPAMAGHVRPCPAMAGHGRPCPAMACCDRSWPKRKCVAVPPRGGINAENNQNLKQKILPGPWRSSRAPEMHQKHKNPYQMEDNNPQGGAARSVPPPCGAAEGGPLLSSIWYGFPMFLRHLQNQWLDFGSTFGQVSEFQGEARGKGLIGPFLMLLPVSKKGPGPSPTH